MYPTSKGYYIFVGTIITLLPYVCLPNPSPNEYISSHLYDAFMKRDGRWDQDILSEITRDIVELINKRTQGLSKTQLKDICVGINNLNNVRSICDMTHPIEKELIKHSLLYWVDSYLTLGPGSQKEIEKLKKQLTPFVATCKHDLLRKFPQHRNIILKTIDKQHNLINKKINNLLHRDYKRSLNEQAVNKLYHTWKSVLELLPDQFSIDTTDPIVYERMLEMNMTIYIHRALKVIRKETMIELLPKPIQLIEAESKIQESYRAISDWRRKKVEEDVLKREEEIRSAYLRKRIGGGEESITKIIDEQLDQLLLQPSRLKQENVTPKNLIDTNYARVETLSRDDQLLDNNFSVVSIAKKEPIIVERILTSMTIMIAVLLGYQWLLWKKKGDGGIHEK